MCVVGGQYKQLLQTEYNLCCCYGSNDSCSSLHCATFIQEVKLVHTEQLMLHSERGCTWSYIHSSTHVFWDILPRILEPAGCAVFESRHDLHERAEVIELQALRSEED